MLFWWICGGESVLLVLLLRHLSSSPWVFFGRNDAKAETPVLWPPHVKSWLIGKDSDAGRDWGQEEKGTTEDEMAGWHHWLDGCESEWTPGIGDGQEGLACCDSWGRKELDTTEQLNWTDRLILKIKTMKKIILHYNYVRYMYCKAKPRSSWLDPERRKYNIRFTYHSWTILELSLFFRPLKFHPKPLNVSLLSFSLLDMRWLFHLKMLFVFCF